MTAVLGNGAIVKPHPVEIIFIVFAVAMLIAFIWAIYWSVKERIRVKKESKNEMVLTSVRARLRVGAFKKFKNSNENTE